MSHNRKFKLGDPARYKGMPEITMTVEKILPDGRLVLKQKRVKTTLTVKVDDIL